MTDTEESRHRAVLRVSPQHPALPGHFPGRPVVPGVVILDEVIAAAERCCGRSLHVTGLPNAKFLAPLQPGAAAVVEFSRRGTHWSFTVACDETVIAQGRLVAAPVSDP